MRSNVSFLKLEARALQGSFFHCSFLRRSLLVSCVFILAGCSSVTQPFASAEFGLVPDQDNTTAVADNDSSDANDPTARASMATPPAPADSDSKKKRATEITVPGNGQPSNGSTQPRDSQHSTEDSVVPNPRSSMFNEMTGLPNVSPVLTQLYFDGAASMADQFQPRTSHYRAAARTSDSSLVPVVPVAAQNVNVSSQPVSLSTGEKRASHLPGIPLAALCAIALICAAAIYGYKKETQRLVELELDQIRKRRDTLLTDNQMAFGRKKSS